MTRSNALSYQNLQLLSAAMCVLGNARIWKVLLHFWLTTRRLNPLLKWVPAILLGSLIVFNERLLSIISKNYRRVYFSEVESVSVIAFKEISLHETHQGD
jgi:hypothetical protein